MCYLRFVWVIRCTVGLMNSPASGLIQVLYTNLLKAFAQYFPSSQMCRHDSLASEQAPNKTFHSWLKERLEEIMSYRKSSRKILP